MGTARTAAVMPLRYVDNVDALRAFYIDRLGFSHMMGIVGSDGALDFCIVEWNGASLMLSRPQQPGEITRGPLEIYIESADVDADHARIVGNGLKPARELTDQWWGDRTFAVEDPAGVLVWYWQTVAEPRPPEGVVMV